MRGKDEGRKTRTEIKYGADSRTVSVLSRTLEDTGAVMDRGELAIRTSGQEQRGS